MADAYSDVVIAGGGAAGIFAAVNLAAMNPDLRITVLEKSPKLLSKVKISGGGRCNVTHACFASDNYCRLAIGRDYESAAPVRGVRRGGGAESMIIDVQIVPQ